MVGRQRRHGDGAEDDRDGRADAPEERPAGLVGDEERDRRQHGRLVQDDLGRVEEADPRDEREEPVPERERVAGVKPAVGELVDGVERERAERIQLLHAREVEEPVAADVPGDVPEQEPEQRAGAERPSACPGSAPPSGRCGANRSATMPGTSRRSERQRQRRADGERHRQRAEDERERPRERRRDAADPERPRDERARQQQHDVREHELDERHRSSSSGMLAVPSQSAVSRYMRPRSPRKSSPRRLVAARSSFRARSA